MSRIAVTINGRTYEIDVRQNFADPTVFSASVDGEEIDIYVPGADPSQPIEWIVVDRHPYEVIFDRSLRWVQSGRRRHHLELHDMEATFARPVSGDGGIKAPIPGLITRVLVEPGQQVTAGQSLVVLEAMKMENEIRAPRSGVVLRIDVQPGQSVTLDAMLVEVG